MLVKKAKNILRYRQFPYNSGSITGQTSHTFAIPLDNLALQFSCPTADKTLYLAAHAAVRKPAADGGYQTETGWSEGAKITSKGNWATASSFVLTCDCGAPPTEYVEQCETSFAYLPGTCFLDLGDLLVTNRWGWTNGPLTPGNYSMQLWAGAGQCDTGKGYLAGTVSVDYADGSAKVAFNTGSTEWYLKETHLYVGSGILPTADSQYTVAPGQFPYQQASLVDPETSSYTVTPLTGGVYLVGHATVCRMVPVQ